MRILPEQEKQRLITVALDGSGDYRSIKEAVDHAPGGTAEQRTVIHIRDGVYNEKLHIEKPFLHLVGESAEGTIITYDDYARKTFPDGSPYHTFNSYTALFGADDLTVENLTIRNDAGRGSLSDRRWPPMWTATASASEIAALSGIRIRCSPVRCRINR